MTMMMMKMWVLLSAAFDSIHVNRSAAGGEMSLGKGGGCGGWTGLGGVTFVVVVAAAAMVVVVVVEEVPPDRDR
jgi:hypothetical protein